MENTLEFNNKASTAIKDKYGLLKEICRELMLSKGPKYTLCLLDDNFKILGFLIFVSLCFL